MQTGKQVIIQKHHIRFSTINPSPTYDSILTLNVITEWEMSSIVENNFSDFVERRVNIIIEHALQIHTY